MKKLNKILNVIIGSSIGIFIGHSSYIIYDVNRHPDYYAMQSAPWYSSMLLYGAITIVLIVSCVAVKAIIKRRK